MTIQTIKAEVLSMDRGQLKDLVETIQYRRQEISQQLPKSGPPRRKLYPRNKYSLIKASLQHSLEVLFYLNYL